MSPPWRPAEERLAGAIRLVPALLLSEILEETAGSLRFEGISMVEGGPRMRIAALHRGERLELFFDEALRMSAWESHHVDGDVRRR